MKRVSVILLAAAVGLSLSTAAMAQNPEHTLSFNLTFSPTHNRWVHAVKPWVDELEKRSQGKIIVEPYFAGALSKQPEVMDSVRTGMADLGEAGYSVGIGNFLFHEQLLAIARPSRYLSDSMKLMKAMEESFPEVAEKDWNNTHYILTHSSEGGSFIGTCTAPITSLDQLKGMKIGVPGGGLPAARLKALGVTVVGIPTPDLYMSLEKGVIDGAVVDMDLLVSRRLGELIKHVTLLGLGGSCWYMTMGEATYDNMSDELKTIVNSISGDYAYNLFDKFWKNVQSSSTNRWVSEMKGNVYMLSDEDYARADKIFEEIDREQWVSFLAEKGLPAEQMYKKFRELEMQFSVPMKECELVDFVK